MVQHADKSDPPREPRLWEALIPVMVLVMLISITIILYDGTAHIPLILTTAVACLLAVRLGYQWSELEDGLVHGITLGLKACLVLMVIGTLIGTWILSGIVPAMVYYGLKLISPSVFLVTTCIVCALVSISTGSSWSTAGTVGLAFIAIGRTLGVPAPMVAGAIISGAYFGDKMSPLSDTTNLAPATAGTDLFTHIRHMLYTTGPSMLVACVGYIILGAFYGGGEGEAASIGVMLDTISQTFYIHWWLLVAPAMVIVMVLLRIPALPALLAGAVLGGLVAIAAQGAQVDAVISAAFKGYVSKTGMARVDSLLTRGGLTNMMETIALIICALSFGGVMEKTGMLAVIARATLRLATSTGLLVTTTILTCIGFNLVSSDQYISIVIPGRMYRQAFLARGLHPKNLSRCLEDSGTLSSPLIPWNTCGAFMGAALGVSPLAYLPFAFLNLFNPLVSIFYGFTGLTMHPLPEGDKEST